MRNKLKMKAAAAAVAIGLAVLSGAASAAFTIYSPITTFEDDDVDFVIKGTGNTGIMTLQVGDTLVSMLEITKTTKPGTAISNDLLPQELSGVAAVTLLGFADLDGLGGANDMIFGPATAGLNAYLGTKSVVGGAAGGGAMVALFLDSTPDLTTTGSTNCTSLADCITRAVDGTLVEVDGFAGDPDEFWVARNAATDLQLVLDSNENDNLGGINFGLSILDNGGYPFANEGVTCTGLSALLCNGNDKIGVLGSGSILGGSGLAPGIVADGAVAHSDFDFQKGVIPEPGTLALLGLGLLGMAGLGRKKKS